MRDRRAIGGRTAARTLGPGGIVTAAALPLWACVARRPVDTAAILTAAAASVVIIVNAIFMQSDPHAAPFVTNPVATVPVADNRIAGAATAAAAPKPAEPVSTRSTVVPPRSVQPVSNRRNDPIADLIGTTAGGPSSRVIAVQSVLSAFGYGQIRPSGILDESTKVAIEKFESEHKMPITGRLSDRLVSELANMTGHPIR